MTTIPLFDVASKLIAFDTESSKSNLEAIAFIAECLSSAGMKVSIQEDDHFGTKKANIVASVGPAESGGLIISGHIDTVPFSNQTGWNTDPLKFTPVGSRIVGRGASDMKCFLAQCIFAASIFDFGKLKKPLVFAFTYDEEVGCGGAARLSAEIDRMLEDIPVPQIAWIGEPTSGKVFCAHKSSVIFQVTIKGLAAHSGTPQNGINAVAVMSRIVSIIDRYSLELSSKPNKALEDVFPKSAFTSINISGISGGSGINIVPDRCTLDLYYRSLPDEDPLIAYREISRRIQSDTLTAYGVSAGPGEVEISEPFVLGGMLAKRGSNLEDALVDVSGRSDCTGAPFGSDGCMFAKVGIDSLIFGPGDIDEAHCPNESISIDSFEEGYRAVLSVIENVCC